MGTIGRRHKIFTTKQPLSTYICSSVRFSSLFLIHHACTWTSPEIICQLFKFFSPFFSRTIVPNSYIMLWHIYGIFLVVHTAKMFILMILIMYAPRSLFPGRSGWTCFLSVNRISGCWSWGPLSLWPTPRSHRKHLCPNKRKNQIWVLWERGRIYFRYKP